MTVIATGINKVLTYLKEVTFGDMAGPAGGQMLRRVTSNLDLQKNTYKSNEIRPDRQRADFRHGTRSIAGTIAGELSPGTYKDFIATVLRQAWQAAATTGALTNITASAAGPHFVRAAGSFLTDGFKVGDVVRWSGWATTATGNNANNFLITALTATQMTGLFLNGAAVAAKASGDSVTCALVGKKTWVPQTGHVNDSYTIEHFFSDIGQSEVFTGCRVSQMDIKMPATGMATIDTQFMGKDMVPSQAQYLTNPLPVSTGTSLAAVNGALSLGGAQVGLITGMNIAINANASKGEVIGSNTTPDIFVGPIDVTGQMTVYFSDASARDMFVNETEVSIVAAFTTNNNANADFMSFVMPRVKVGGASKDDGEKGLIMTMPYTALLNVNGGTNANSLATTISVQDSTVS